jgi:hypothetical protein
MTQQPEALRLADWLFNNVAHINHAEAAAELRRLHALCGEWENKAATWLASPEAAKRLDGYRELAQRLNAAEASNAQLLEALEATTAMLDRSNCLTGYCCCGSPIDGHGFGDGHTPTDEGAYHQTAALGLARAAIAAAKGEA